MHFPLIVRIPSHIFHPHCPSLLVPQMPDHAEIRICITFISRCPVSDYIRYRYSTFFFTQYNAFFLSFPILLMPVSAQIRTDPLLEKHTCQFISLIFLQVIKTIMADSNTRQVSPAQFIPYFLRCCCQCIRHLSGFFRTVRNQCCI